MCPRGNIFVFPWKFSILQKNKIGSKTKKPLSKLNFEMQRLQVQRGSKHAAHDSEGQEENQK